MQIRKSTNNYINSKLFTEFSGGLNHSTEHHLFPTVSHCHYSKISPIIANYCRQNNFPYNVEESFTKLYFSYIKLMNYVKIK